jgi:hypothetical protein
MTKRTAGGQPPRRRRAETARNRSQSGSRAAPVDIARLRERMQSGRYLVSFTHTEKLRARRIRARDLERAIDRGVVIEDYADDPRGRSCLVLGWAGRRALHVVCACVEEDEILIVTAYEPGEVEWEADLRTRKRRKA